MRLFQIQDDNRPAFVAAEDYQSAVAAWKSQIEKENDGESSEPARVSMIADDDELIIFGNTSGIICFNGLD